MKNEEQQVITMKVVGNKNNKNKNNKNISELTAEKRKEK